MGEAKQTTTTKYTVKYTATVSGSRTQKSVDVFAESKPEAREAALNAAEEKGHSSVLLNAAIKN